MYVPMPKAQIWNKLKTFNFCYFLQMFFFLSFYSELIVVVHNYYSIINRQEKKFIVIDIRYQFYARAVR